MTAVEPRKRAKVLVVDDEELIRGLLRRKLTIEGYEVEAAEDGAEAVAILEREFYNLVLTDIRMPNMDGIQVLKRAKSIHEVTEVIIMTAYATVDTAVEAVRAGAFDYIRKPFDHVDDVAHKARLALGHQRLTLQNREVMRKLDDMNRGLKQMVVSRTKELNEVQEQLRAENQELKDALRGAAALHARLRPAVVEIVDAARAVEGHGAERVRQAAAAVLEIGGELEGVAQALNPRRSSSDSSET